MMTKSDQQANAEHWYGIIKDFLGSNKNRYDYCREHDLDQNRLLYWLGRHYENSRDLVPANVVGNLSTSVCELKLATGHVIDIKDVSVLTTEFADLIKCLGKYNDITI